VNIMRLKSSIWNDSGQCTILTTTELVHLIGGKRRHPLRTTETRDYFIKLLKRYI
jgi:hypothetical protein